MCRIKRRRKWRDLAVKAPFCHFVLFKSTFLSFCTFKKYLFCHTVQLKVSFVILTLFKSTFLSFSAIKSTFFVMLCFYNQLPPLSSSLYLTLNFILFYSTLQTKMLLRAYLSAWREKWSKIKGRIKRKRKWRELRVKALKNPI